MGTSMVGAAAPEDDRTTVRFALLGPIRAWRGETELAVGSPQQRTVLALLLLRDGAFVTTDELVDAVWGGRPPRAAVNTIRTYISRLRRVLGATGGAGALDFVSIGGGYQLRVPRLSVDLGLFRQYTVTARAAAQRGDHDTAAADLRRALALAQGRPMAGASGYYIEAQRDRLTGLLAAATEELLVAEVARGRHVEVLPDLNALVDEHPLREQLRELLILALYRAGRQAEALDRYQQAQRVLAEELGIDPGPGLRRLHAQILTGDQDLLGHAADAGVPAPPVERPAPRHGSTVTSGLRRNHGPARGIPLHPSRTSPVRG